LILSIGNNWIKILCSDFFLYRLTAKSTYGIFFFVDIWYKLIEV